MRIILLILLLLVTLSVRAHDTRSVSDNDDPDVITIENVECVGSDRAIVVCVLGMGAKSVRFGDKALPKLCSAQTEMGYGSVEIYGLQLGDGHTIADVTVEVENKRYSEVEVHSVADVNQSLPFIVTEALRGFNSPAMLTIEGTSPNERIVGGVSLFALNWARVRILNLVTNIMGQEARTIIETYHYGPVYWVAAHVRINPKENSTVRPAKVIRQTRKPAYR